MQFQVHVAVLTDDYTSQQQFTFLILNAHFYIKFPAEQGNNVLFSVQAFVRKKVDI